MDAWLQASAGRAGKQPRLDHSARLPDELLVEVFSKLPKQSVLMLKGAVRLATRGSAVERVCRRWRHLALQRLLASLHIDFCELHDQGLDEGRVAKAFGGLLPRIAARCIDQCTLRGCTTSVPLGLPAQLAVTLFPSLHRLSLSGGTLLHFSSFLMRCPWLEVLSLDCEELDNEQAELLGTHLCALSGQLKELRLQLHSMLPMLARYVAGRVPAAVVLRLGASSTAMWLPQLERCAVQFHSDAQLAQLAAGLEQAEAKGLRVLHISDSRSEAARTAAPAQLPTLAGLPQLERLKCTDCLPEAAWRCRHLTSLRCTGGSAQLSEAAAVLCTGLQRLKLTSCTLPDGAFPAALCSLSQLSSLLLSRCKLSHLPTAFSNLSSLRELGIHDARLDASSMAALTPLRLTSLSLSDCHLSSLPHGAYLLGLSSLRIFEPHGGRNNLASPLPFAATAARGLRRLTIDCPTHWLDGMECWAELEWKLHCFPQLELLCLEPDGMWDEGDCDALEELCKATFPRCAMQWCDDDEELWSDDAAADSDIEGDGDGP